MIVSVCVCGGGLYPLLRDYIATSRYSLPNMEIIDGCMDIISAIETAVVVSKRGMGWMP